MMSTKVELDNIGRPLIEQKTKGCPTAMPGVGVLFTLAKAQT